MEKIINGALSYASIAGINDLIDILVVAFVIYKLISLLRDTAAERLLKGIALLFIIMQVVNVLQLSALSYILSYCFTYGAVALLVIFQPELRRILEAQGHEVVSQKELGITIEPEETGTTFAENALIKAETICKASGLPTIADDSGLCVDALDGAPGVYSARYCGHHGDDEANNDKLLAAMQAVPAGQRGAKFVSAVCFILPDGRHLTCMGECPGSIAFTRLCGDYGFGYDPLFIPADCGVGKTDKRPNTENRSYAQLTPDEKDAISHRGNALAALEKQLPDFLAEK